MVQDNCNIKSRGFTHLSSYERGMIKAFLEEGNSLRLIGRKLNRSHETTRREIKRGTVTQLNTQYQYFTVYLPDSGQAIYRLNRKRCIKPKKLDENQEFLKSVEKTMIEKDWSPDSAVGFLKKQAKWINTKTVCTKTIYNYIDKGYLKVKNIDLYLKLRRRVSKNRDKTRKKVYGLSIDLRPEKIARREEFGHWEIDTVVGSKTKGEVLLTLLERKTRYLLIKRLDAKASLSVIEALKDLESTYGISFSKIFKSITADNGSEFSTLGSYLKTKHVPVYYAHPYSSFERGSNERHNGMIRRYIPKGRSINTVSDALILKTTSRINGLPRAILDYRLPLDYFLEQIALI